MNLKVGEYIVIPSTLEKGKEGEFCLEFYFEDEFSDTDSTDSNAFSTDQLTYTEIEKLGGEPGEITLISDYISKKAHLANQNKVNFMLHHFQNKLTNKDSVIVNKKTK